MSSNIAAVIFAIFRYSFLLLQLSCTVSRTSFNGHLPLTVVYHLCVIPDTSTNREIVSRGGCDTCYRVFTSDTATRLFPVSMRENVSFGRDSKLMRSRFSHLTLSLHVKYRRHCNITAFHEEWRLSREHNSYNQMLRLNNFDESMKHGKEHTETFATTLALYCIFFMCIIFEKSVVN